MGAALGILLVFRNNTAYERWWEARKVLGGIVNTSRGLAIQLKVLVPDKEIRKEIISLVAAYFFVLKEHLREGVIMEEISFLPDADKTEIQKWLHKPNCVTNLLMSKIAQIYKAAHITDFQYMQLIGEVNLLIEYIGKCERIKNTPMPLAHKYLLKTYIFVYIMITPFGFVATMGWWTVLAVVAVYFLSVSIVTIADEIENPFGKDLSDLPVDGIAMNIRNNLIEIDEK
jgi:putative membrane protein